VQGPFWPSKAVAEEAAAMVARAMEYFILDFWIVVFK
jgi:hypothetical protein